jgi:hypothetical protein
MKILTISVWEFNLHITETGGIPYITGLEAGFLTIKGIRTEKTL